MAEDHLASPEVAPAPALGGESSTGAPDQVSAAAAARALGAGPGNLRRTAVRGTIINGAFLTALNGLNVLKGFAAAAFLTRADYGVWGILSVTLVSFLSLKQIGITDRYIQQAEEDQEVAFQRAFTVEVLVTGAFVGVMALLIPLVAVLYADSRLLLPGWVLVLGILAIALQSPLWVYYRRMDFVRQRSLQAIDPVISFVVTVALAVAGFGYWSLVIGTVAGSWAAALVAMRSSPYKLRLRYERGSVRDYFSYSWPLALATVSGLLISQGSVLAGRWFLGVAGVGSLVLANSLALYVNRVDDIVSETIYPAVCAVRDRADVLLETFLKSNRLAMLWALPFGVGVAIFTPDIIRFGLGEHWRPAEVAIQAFALVAAMNQIGFNWVLFYKARGDTRPMAVSAVVMLLAMATIAFPLLIVAGIDGFSLGLAISAAIQLGVRVWYLLRLFPGLAMVRHAARAMAPTLPAAGLLLILRALAGTPSSLGVAAAELLLFLAIVATVTAFLERALIAEVRGYFRAPATVAKASVSAAG